MKCMSCRQADLVTGNTKFFGHIVVCLQCHALAEKAEAEINKNIEMAKQHAKNWLEHHVLSGGLVRGGSGNDVQAAGRASFFAPQVQEVSDTEAHRGSAVSLAGGESSTG